MASITSCILLDCNVSVDLKVAFNRAEIRTLLLDTDESSYFQENLQSNSGDDCVQIINNVRVIIVANTFCYDGRYKSALENIIKRIVSNDLIVTSMGDAILVRDHFYKKNKKLLPNIYISNENNENSILTSIGVSKRFIYYN